MLFGALASYFVLLNERGGEFHDSKAAGLKNLSTWNHRCMLNLWRKTVSIILMCIHMVVSLTICSCVSAYNVKIVV